MSNQNPDQIQEAAAANPVSVPREKRNLDYFLTRIGEVWYRTTDSILEVGENPQYGSWASTHPALGSYLAGRTSLRILRTRDRRKSLSRIFIAPSFSRRRETAPGLAMGKPSLERSKK
jgi:hypothetical protein